MKQILILAFLLAQLSIASSATAQHTHAESNNFALRLLQDEYLNCAAYFGIVSKFTDLVMAESENFLPDDLMLSYKNYQDKALSKAYQLGKQLHLESEMLLAIHRAAARHHLARINENAENFMVLFYEYHDSCIYAVNHHRERYQYWVSRVE